MLLLGESVLALITVEESPGRRYYVTFVTGIVSVTMLQYLYFRSAPPLAEDHALNSSLRFAGFQFFYSLLVFSACLVVIGCSFKVILHIYLDEAEKESETDEEATDLKDYARRVIEMFSWSLATAFFFLDLVVISHRGWKSYFARMVQGGKIQWAPVLCSIVDLGAVALTACFPCFISDLEVLSVAGCAIILVQVLLRSLGLRYFPVSKHAMNVALGGEQQSNPSLS